MAFTYDPERLDLPLNRVRLLIQDTVEDDPLLQNEEILSFVEEEGNVYRAAAAACDSIALKLGRESDSKGETQWLSKEKAEHYTGRARELRQRAKGRAKPAAGGLSKSEKRAVADDTDRTQPAFTRELHEIPAGALDGPTAGRP